LAKRRIEIATRFTSEQRGTLNRTRKRIESR
jgi:hypothetical protein